jgi:hypothetical protein
MRIMRHAAMHSRLIVRDSGHSSARPYATPIVHTTDFIPDDSRSAFNGFEKADVSGWFYAGVYPYVEDGISVAQAFGAPPTSIWMTCGAIRAKGYCFGETGHEGKYSWYPSGGDSGFTVLRLADGGEFGNVGFLTGNAYTTVDDTYLKYTLVNKGAVVLTGELLVPKGSPDRGYLGFEGGGFDQIQISEIPVGGGKNLLAIDSIEMSALAVPEPGSLSLLVIAMAALLSRRRPRN